MARAKKRRNEAGDGKVWGKSSVPNLFIYLPKNSYYLRARIGGQIVRKSLRTTNHRVALVRLSEELRERRLIAGTGDAENAPETLVEALNLVRKKIDATPGLKANSKSLYLIEMDALNEGKEAAVPATPLSKLGKREMEAWWSRVSSLYGPQRANHSLMFVRWALKIGRQSGAMIGNPTEGLKRAHVPRTRLLLPTPAQFLALAKSIRERNPEAADWVEFMAYSGLRPMEIRALLWEHIDEASGCMWVYGGKGRSKTEARRVPIIEPMRALLTTIRAGEERAGKVFKLQNPVLAFKNACARLKLPSWRLYDLRHLFATTCLESGVDVPTFSAWMGHKDGGALAMRTYVQNRDAHSDASAAKVRFS